MGVTTAGANRNTRSTLRDLMAVLTPSASSSPNPFWMSVGVMVPDLHNPFFAQVIDGMMDQLQHTDYQVLLGPSRCGHEAETRATEAMIDHSMDGVILIAPTSAQARLDQTARTVPTVVIGRHGRSAAYDTVVDDDITGAALVVG